MRDCKGLEDEEKQTCIETAISQLTLTPEEEGYRACFELFKDDFLQFKKDKKECLRACHETNEEDSEEESD